MERTRSSRRPAPPSLLSDSYRSPRLPPISSHSQVISSLPTPSPLPLLLLTRISLPPTPSPLLLFDVALLRPNSLLLLLSFNSSPPRSSRSRLQQTSQRIEDRSSTYSRAGSKEARSCSCESSRCCRRRSG